MGGGGEREEEVTAVSQGWERRKGQERLGVRERLGELVKENFLFFCLHSLGHRTDHQTHEAKGK